MCGRKYFENVVGNICERACGVAHLLSTTEKKNRPFKALWFREWKINRQFRRNKKCKNNGILCKFECVWAGKIVLSFWATCSFPFSYAPFHVLRFDSIRCGISVWYVSILFIYVKYTQRPSTNVWNLRSAEDKYDMLHIFWHNSLSLFNPHTRIHLHRVPPFHTFTRALLPYLYWIISISNTAHSSSPLLVFVCYRMFSCSSQTNIITQSINI